MRSDAERNAQAFQELKWKLDDLAAALRTAAAAESRVKAAQEQLEWLRLRLT